VGPRPPQPVPLHSKRRRSFAGKKRVFISALHRYLYSTHQMAWPNESHNTSDCAVLGREYSSHELWIVLNPPSCNGSSAPAGHLGYYARYITLCRTPRPHTTFDVSSTASSISDTGSRSVWGRQRVHKARRVADKSRNKPERAGCDA
jgi:hypothetical protein